MPVQKNINLSPNHFSSIFTLRYFIPKDKYRSCYNLIPKATETWAHGSALNRHTGESSAARSVCLTCAENAMIATVMASVAPIVMRTAMVLWKEAMVPAT